MNELHKCINATSNLNYAINWDESTICPLNGDSSLAQIPVPTFLLLLQIQVFR